MDRAFIEKIYNEYFGLVKLIVKNTIHTPNPDDINSCVHDVFMIAMQKDGLEKHTNIKAWLLVTAKNVVKMFNRQRAIQNKHYDFFVDFEKFEPLMGDFSDFVIDKIDSERFRGVDLNRAVYESLTQNEKDFYSLLYYKKMNVKDISKVLNISEGAAATRCSRLKGKIKDILNNL